MSGAITRARGTRDRAVDPRAHAEFMSIREARPESSIIDAVKSLRERWDPRWGRSPSYMTARQWAKRHLERGSMPASTGRILDPTNRGVRK